jgi:hypothetical protein
MIWLTVIVVIAGVVALCCTSQRGDRDQQRQAIATAPSEQKYLAMGHLDGWPRLVGGVTSGDHQRTIRLAQDLGRAASAPSRRWCLLSSDLGAYGPRYHAAHSKY